ncbi:alpha/beta fold hydrolase [Thermodesulfobacteriota bacterium]
MNTAFLHGLDSSGRGTKGNWFRQHFPDMLIPDFNGPLKERMGQLNRLLTPLTEIFLVGSSFGGLMATIYALENELKISGMILLAPALNFPDFSLYSGRTTAVPTRLYIGSLDDVTPPDKVIPAAVNTFVNLEIHESDDDHLLRNTFSMIDWEGCFAV